MTKRTSKGKFQVAVIGHGRAAAAHIPAINATNKAVVTTICSARPLDEAKLSADYGCKIAVTHSFESVLNDSNIDVVDIAGFPDVHAAQFITAANAGKHIIVEKPMSMTQIGCEAMMEAAKRNGIHSCVCFEAKFSTQFQAARSMINEGLLGDLHYGEVDFYHGSGPWHERFGWNASKARGGSALLTAGSHALDALLMFLGNDVEEVTSYSTRSRSEVFAAYEYDTSSTTIVKFRSGKVGKCASIADCLQPDYFRTHLVGSHGTLLDNKFYSSKLACDRNEWSTLVTPMLDSGDLKNHPYHAQFQAFFDSLAKGEDMPLTSLGEAMNTFRVLFAADESAATGRPVKLI